MSRKRNFLIKTISVLLCMTMMSGLFTVAQAEDNLNWEERIEFLKVVGVLGTDVDATTIKADEEVTRGDFAQYIAKVVANGRKPSDVLYYNDVPKTHEAYDEITILTDMGYLKGSGDKFFMPENVMKTEYTYKVFANILGCGPIIEANAQNPNFLRKLCSECGILDNVSNIEGTMTTDTLLTMIYNTLLAKSYGIDNKLKNVVLSDESYLYNSRGMKYVKNGLLTAIGNMDIYGNSHDDDVVVIGGVEYTAPDFDIDDYLGRKVNFIYSEDKQDSTKKIVWIKAREDSDVFELTVDPDCKFDRATGKLTYLKNDKERNVTIPENIIMIYNGKFKVGNVRDVFSHDRYKLRLLKASSRDDQYSTAIVQEYYNLLVNFKNKNDLSVVDENGNILSLDPAEYDSLKIMNDVGAEMTFEEITEKSVLSIYKSDDGKKVKVISCNNQECGKISSVSADGILVNGKLYNFYDVNASTKDLAGREMRLYLDAEGYVVATEADSTSDSFVAFLMSGINYENEAGDDALRLKLLKEDGRIETFEITDRIRVNDRVFKQNMSGAVSELGRAGSGAKPQLIKVKLNSNKQIKDIYTAFENDGKPHELFVSNRIEKSSSDTDESYAYYGTGGGRLGPKVAVGPKTRVFYVPEESDIINGAEDKYFYVSGLQTGTYPNAVTYRISDKAQFLEDYIVIRRSSIGDKLSEYPVMVDKIIDTIDEEDMPVTKLTCVNAQGVTEEYLVDSDVDFASYKLKKGDLIRYAQSKLTSKITNIEITYQPSTNKLKEVGDWTEEYRIFFGYVNSAFADGILLGHDSGSTIDEALNMVVSGVNTIILYDSQQDKIVIGDYTDLKTYKLYGSACSPMVATSWYTSLRGMFAYR